MFFSRHVAVTAAFHMSSTLALTVPSSRFPSLSTNISSVSNVDAKPNRISTNCDENLYGKPIIKSCLNVYTQISDDDKVIEFGDRSQGLYEYALPYRIISTDGTCVVDVEASPGFHADKATMAQISAAAMQLLNICVFPEGAGGKSMGYGQQGGLSITMEQYTPQVECQQDVARYKDKDLRKCHELLSLMPVSEDLQTFGKAGAPGVEVELPFELASPGGECGFYFNMDGPPQRNNWHNLWQSANAIWGICGRKQQQGIAFSGAQKKFSIAMHRPSHDDLHTVEMSVKGASDTAR